METWSGDEALLMIAANLHLLKDTGRGCLLFCCDAYLPNIITLMSVLKMGNQSCLKDELFAQHQEGKREVPNPPRRGTAMSGTRGVLYLAGKRTP